MVVKNWFLLFISGGLAMVLASAVHAEGDPVAGEAKAGLCAGCHGEAGKSEVGMFPRLAGQYGDYIVKQIRDFQRGHRANNEIMAGMAGTIASVQDAKDLGAYFESQEIPEQPVMPPNADLVAQGERIYVDGNDSTGVYGCINCHGPKGIGRAPDISQFPRLVGQHKEYIVKQLQDFREGTRKNDPAGMMTDIAKKLSDEEIQAVAEYLSAQLP